MLRLIYISTARSQLSRAELGNILRVSRENNARSDVTGLLVTGGRRVLQALEGPPEAVDATFERIRRDPRHFAAVVLSRVTVHERSFGDWAMGCQLSPPPEGCSGVSTATASLIARIADDRVRAEFEQFAQQQQTAQPQ